MKNNLKYHKKSDFNEPIFNLKVSESHKYKNDCQWFKDYIEYLLPFDSCVVDDYSEMKLAYEVLNNNLEGFKSQLDDFCNPLGSEEMSGLDFSKDTVIPYNKIHTKVNTFLGELLKRDDDPKIILISDKEIKDKTKEQVAAIRKSIQERADLQIEIEKMKQAGKKEREIEEYVEQYTTQESPEDIASKSFLSEWEILNTKALKYCKYAQDLKTKQQVTMKHLLASDKVFIYVGWKYGKPYIDVVNPLFCGYCKSPNTFEVEKGSSFWRKTAVTIADIYNEYVHKLTDQEIAELGVYNYASSLGVNKHHDVMGKHAKMQFDNTTQMMYQENADTGNKRVGHSQDEGSSKNYHTNRLVWKTHIEFVAYKKLIFIEFPDETGYMIKEVAPPDFEIPAHAEKTTNKNEFGLETEVHTWVNKMLGISFKAETMWIPRRYEITRLSQDIYVDCREVPNQPFNIESPYESFELSYKGGVLSSFNAKGQSIISRALPPLFQYLFVKKIQSRELAKYQGFVLDIDVDQIPDYLALDSEGEPIPGRDKVAIWRTYMKRLGINIYSGSQSSNGLPPATRSPGSKSNMTGTAMELINLTQMLELLDVEISMSMGLSPQREANFTAGSNVTDNQNAIAMSYHITEPVFYFHSSVWKRALSEWLKLFRIYMEKIFEDTGKKEHFIHYITPNDTQELLKITPDKLDYNDVGLFLSLGGQDKLYRDSMLNLTHAFGQNAGDGMELMSGLVKSIAAGDSPQEIHKMIKVEAKKQQDRIAQQQEQAEKAAQKNQQMEIESREDGQAHEIEKIHLEGKYSLQEKMIDVYKFQEDLNKDQDGIPDPLEAVMAMHSMQMEQDKAQRENRKLNMEQAKIIDEKAVKQKELAIKQASANKTTEPKS